MSGFKEHMERAKEIYRKMLPILPAEVLTVGNYEAELSIEVENEQEIEQQTEISISAVRNNINTGALLHLLHGLRICLKRISMLMKRI